MHYFLFFLIDKVAEENAKSQGEEGNLSQGLLH